MDTIASEHADHYGSPPNPPIGYECECGEWQITETANDLPRLDYCNDCYKNIQEEEE